ncbi:uncharacterized protein LOC129595440 [Paramacrobiotus metropolitanus]|uniref:uncharacterized protein LOC129595440 n=1 Tax=Paramacrobiotus metropolitanus TaxID=2943436 RepID=UPI0024464BF4|nr:uncharacterized protein LOC129595440 [Paramacrobiotus metropolitanus]
MHLYREKHCRYQPVRQWNSVDVLTESGLFQHGEVINVAENGLIVDFHCSGQRSLFVSYDKIFDAASSPFSEVYENWHHELQWNPALTENASVQVLCRPHPGAAWLWYPARLLHRAFFFPFDDIGLVWAAVDVGGRQLTELFTADQVRCPPAVPLETPGPGALPPGCFAVRECHLPVDFLSLTTFPSSDRFLQLLETRKRAIRVLAIRGDSLQYLQRTEAKPMSDGEVQKVYKSSTEPSSERQNSDEDDTPEPQLPTVVESSRKRKHPDDDAQPEVEWVLPTAPHLLREIFDSLDSVSLLKLRRVCPLWNTVLTGADSAKTVRVSFRKNPFSTQEKGRFFQLFGAVGGLLKCSTATTERIIIEHPVAEHVEGVLGVLKYALKNLRLKQLIFHHVEMDWDDSFEHDYTSSGVVAFEVSDGGKTFIRRLAKTLRNWAPYCDELRLRRCEFTCIEGKMTAVIPHATITLDAADIEAQLWNLYEAHLSRDGINLEETAEWIRTGSEELRMMVAQYLVDWQSYDPRSTVHYRGHEWTVDNLQDLDVAKLTTITLRALKERLPDDMEEAK